MSRITEILMKLDKSLDTFEKYGMIDRLNKDINRAKCYLENNILSLTQSEKSCWLALIESNILRLSALKEGMQK